MQNRQLQTWLSDDEYEQIVAEWDTQKLFREELRDKPSELKRYEDKLDSKCESLCEDALEILQ